MCDFIGSPNARQKRIREEKRGRVGTKLESEREREREREREGGKVERMKGEL